MILFHGFEGAYLLKPEPHLSQHVNCRIEFASLIASLLGMKNRPGLRCYPEPDCPGNNLAQHEAVGLIQNGMLPAPKENGSEPNMSSLQRLEATL